MKTRVTVIQQPNEHGRYAWTARKGTEWLETGTAATVELAWRAAWQAVRDRAKEAA